MAIEIPDRMLRLPLDPRGYPIPFVVYRDRDGTAHFTINDNDRMAFVLRHDRCPICNGTLFRGRWFVGGPASAFHERGAYLDPPVHRECAEYSLQVCPYLAAPNYSKRIDARTLDPAKAHATMILADPSVDNARPPLFVAVMTVGQTVSNDGRWIHLRPKRPYRAMTYWRHGRKITAAQARPLIDEELKRWPADGEGITFG